MDSLVGRYFHAHEPPDHPETAGVGRPREGIWSPSPQIEIALSHSDPILTVNSLAPCRLSSREEEEPHFHLWVLGKLFQGDKTRMPARGWLKVAIIMRDLHPKIQVHKHSHSQIHMP